MPNDFYNVSGAPSQGSFGSSATIRAEFTALAAGFDKMPALAGNNSKLLRVNSSGTALEALTSGGANMPLLDGSMSAPSLHFANETSTGIYRNGAGTLVFGVLGAEVVRLTASGLAFVGLVSGSSASLTGPSNQLVIRPTAETGIGIATFTNAAGTRRLEFLYSGTGSSG